MGTSITILVVGGRMGHFGASHSRERKGGDAKVGEKVLGEGRPVGVTTGQSRRGRTSESARGLRGWDKQHTE